MTDRNEASVPAATVGSEGSVDPAAEARRLPSPIWAVTLQALANLVAHDFRNALNGVAVNLEVVRGRSARGAESSAIAPFAATAAAQFEAASAAAEALLAFARPEPGDPDVAAIALRLARLVGLRQPAKLRVLDSSNGRARTTVPGDIARAAVARSVLSALDIGDTISCEITVGGDIFLHVTAETRVPPPPDSETVAVISRYGVRFATRGHTLEVRFPALDSRATANPQPPE